MKKIISTLLIVLVTTLGFVSMNTPSIDAATNTKIMYVKNATPLKATASANAKTIYSAKTGQTVKVYTTTSKKYVKATISNKTGWMLKSNLTNTKTVKATVKESIKYGTTKQKDSSLPKGATIVVKKGKNGVRTKTVEYTYKNGKIVAKKTLSSKVTAQPVNEIVKVGTSKSKYLPATEARKILEKSGFEKVDSKNYEFYYGDAHLVLRVTVGSKHVTRIFWDGSWYQMKDGSLQEYIEGWGKKQGKEEYQYAQESRAKIRKALKGATNALYGPGTTNAKSLYNKLIKSDYFAKSY